MSTPCKTCCNPATPDRRTLLLRSGAAIVLGLVGAGSLSRPSRAEALTKAERDKLSPDDILALMKKGNHRFYTGQRENYNFLAQQRASAAAQYPAAVLLSC